MAVSGSAAGRGAWRDDLRRAALVYLALRLLLIPLGYLFDQAAGIRQIDQLPVRWFDYATLPWNRYDTVYYLTLAKDGYGYEPATLGFHPLFAWVARPFGWLLGDWLLGLTVVAALAGIGALALAARLARLELGDEAGGRAVLAFMALPSAYVIFAPYVESLFLCCAIGCLLCARRGRWWLAGLLGGLAALTRQQGVALAAPLLWEMMVAAGGWRQLLRRWRWWPAAALPGLALIGLSLYRVLALGDGPADWWRPANWIFGFLISPNARLVMPDQRFLPPWEAFWLAARQTAGRMGDPSPEVWLDLALGCVYLALLAWAWRRLRWSYRIYAALIFLLAFSHHTAEPFAYVALPRHLLLAFPLLLPVAEWARTPRRRQYLFLGAALVFLLQSALHASNGWVP